MALISLVGLVRAAVLGPAVAAAAYLALAGFEGSRRLVSPNQPERPCRTPASNGWRYEAINYDQATDGVLIGRTGTDCRVGGAGAGDQVVTSDGVTISGWWITSGQ
ncbi:MAG: hypothetical protein ACRDGJ_10425 [Candidatus Limnocylindria bacterium]